VHRYRLQFILLLSLPGISNLSAQEVLVQLESPDSVASGQDFEIAVVIAKGEHIGFAKVQLEIPPDFQVDSLDGDSARYIEDGSKVKYVWDRMPKKDTLRVKFRVSTYAGYSGTKGINGIFAYINAEDEKKEIEIATKVIKIQQAAFASVSEEAAAEPDESMSEKPTLSEEPSIPVEETTAPPVPEEKSEEITVTKSEKPVIETKSDPLPKVESSGSLIEFRIQIIASSLKMNTDKLKAKYNIEGTVRAELHNGLWKYTVGSYPDYYAAKNDIHTYRDDKGVSGAFVTAYENGKRIAVGTAINKTK